MFEELNKDNKVDNDIRVIAAKLLRAYVSKSEAQDDVETAQSQVHLSNLAAKQCMNPEGEDGALRVMMYMSTIQIMRFLADIKQQLAEWEWERMEALCDKIPEETFLPVLKQVKEEIEQKYENHHGSINDDSDGQSIEELLKVLREKFKGGDT